MPKKKARLGLYLEDEEMARQIKIAAARRRTSVSRYCGDAIRERLVRDGEKKTIGDSVGDADREELAFLARVDQLREEIGPIGIKASELVKAGRRR